MKKNNIVTILCILVMLIIIFLTYVQSQTFLIEFDDSTEIFFADFMPKIKSLFIYHGRFFINLITKIIAFIIPSFFNIHPISWIQSGGSIIKSFFVIMILFLLADFLFLFNKKNIFYPIFCLDLFVLYEFIFLYQFQNELYTAFYGFTFPFIFLFLFFKLYIDEILNLNLDNLKNNSFIVYIFTFLSACATEFTAIINTLFLSIFLLLLNTNKHIKNKNIIKKTKYLLFTSILGNCFLFLNFGFISTANSKGTLNGIKNTIETAISVLPEYIHGFKTVFIDNYMIFFIVVKN